MSKDCVVLVHGIWMSGLDMLLLNKRLCAAGYSTYQFVYKSVRSTPVENAMQLQDFVKKIDAPVIHYVCHSLGGLLIRHFFNENDQQPDGRIVTLGTPHSPSSAAKKLSGTPPGRWILGNSLRQGLLGPVPPWSGTHNLGVIAGTLRLGIGTIIPGIPRPNDGTVAVEETRLAGMEDHLTLPVSHFGMLTSKTVAQQTIYFLKHGKFKIRQSCLGG